MTKYILAALGGAAILAGSGWAQDSRDIEVGAFDRVEARGGLRIEIVRGDNPGVRLEGNGSDFDDIEVAVQGDELRIRQDTGWFMRNRQLDVVVHVTMRDFESLDFSRGISARVTDIQAGHLDVDINTGAAARLSGTCETLVIGLSTGVSLNARDLVCEDVELEASTGADASVHATSRIEARASMGADIDVYGSPGQRDVSASMGGDISFRN